MINRILHSWSFYKKLMKLTEGSFINFMRNDDSYQILYLQEDYIPYFFDYKTEFFSFQNNPKDLDQSCKTDLDLWDCLGRVKSVL